MDWFLYGNGLRHERVKMGSAVEEVSLVDYERTGYTRCKYLFQV